MNYTDALENYISGVREMTLKQLIAERKRVSNKALFAHSREFRLALLEDQIAKRSHERIQQACT